MSSNSPSPETDPTPSPITALYTTITSSLLQTTRAANALVATDLPFQRTLNRDVGAQLDAQNARLLSLAERLLQRAAGDASVASSGAGPQVQAAHTRNTGVRNPPPAAGAGVRLRDVEDLDTGWRDVVDVLDSLLERADGCLDGVKRARNGLPEHKGMPRTKNDIEKPQTLFDDKQDNSEGRKFKPLLTQKPHAMMPLKESIGYGTNGYGHPYQDEIEAYEFPNSLYTTAESRPYPPFDKTEATFVDTLDGLAEMLKELKKVKEVAIDLEHHDHRSYPGIVCLMQISTRDRDWIVDTLKPWRRRLECLNEVFANPKVLKVFHGAQSDIIWLQRDLGLYVVGLFDTYHAACALNYPAKSLAYLLLKFINFEAQKQHQLADWRTRPLSADLLAYARSDTHFLLHIYDNLRNQLIASSTSLSSSDPDSNLIRQVQDKSKETSLQRYEYPVYDVAHGLGPIGWYKQLFRTPAMFSPEQFAAFRALHHWRDGVARQEDESIHYVMTNHALFSIARSLPTDKTKLYQVAGQVSPIMRLRGDDIIAVVAKAVEDGKNGPDMNTVMREVEAVIDEGYHKRAAVREAKAAAKAAVKAEAAKEASPDDAAMLDGAPPAAPIAHADPAPASRFWGPALRAVGGVFAQKRNVHTDVRLALPLPDVGADVFGAAEDTVRAAGAKHVFVREEERISAAAVDDVFSVKGLGGRGTKRKKGWERMAESEGELVVPQTEEGEEEGDMDGALEGGEVEEGDEGEILAGEDTMPEPEGEAGRAARMARKRAAGKEKKRARKAAKAEAKKKAEEGGGGAAVEPVEAVPFDYEAQPSVLHGRVREGRGGAPAGRGKKRQVEGGYDAVRESG
ncbi:hypothetical protein EJ06DRAFT_549457 [Trichodelitschia bisporula]|uniref:HRDC domain-containing protein n=1 Tax=Trichodelitschia bisporula TaxID=703511 RepID=A0A6G1HVQ3_9PEZI|nr:hypothetical protein EJ06DRAFT_549457 [Trichodelitschia bisporula]